MTNALPSLQLWEALKDVEEYIRDGIVHQMNGATSFGGEDMLPVKNAYLICEKLKPMISLSLYQAAQEAIQIAASGLNGMLNVMRQALSEQTPIDEVKLIATVDDIREQTLSQYRKSLEAAETAFRKDIKDNYSRTDKDKMANQTFNLNNTQKDFLRWLVAIVRRDKYKEDSLWFTFDNSSPKMFDGVIQTDHNDNLVLEPSTLDALLREGFLHGEEKSPCTYCCSLSGKAYEAVDRNFQPLPVEPRTVTYNNNFQGSQVGNFANELKDNAQQTAFVSSPEKRTLAEAAKEIQDLLKNLEETNPSATDDEKIVYINDETTPSFKRRVAGALQASGETVIDEFILENKYLKVAKAAFKGWLQAGS